jgi:hypothetical protein
VQAEARTRAVEDTTRRAIVNAIARIDRRLEADMVTPVDA